jgi:hypothetical protein
MDWVTCDNISDILPFLDRDRTKNSEYDPEENKEN